LRQERNTRLHTVTVYFPELGALFADLERRCGKHMMQVADPHITLVNPFYPQVSVSMIARNLGVVARGFAPFSLRLIRLSRFENTDTVMYYVAVENEREVTDLHYAMYESMGGMLRDHYGGKYNLEGFVPHISVSGPVPLDLVPDIEYALIGQSARCEVKIESFSLCAENADRTWTTLETFPLSG
jgi:2'-5' RNA ligase